MDHLPAQTWVLFSYHWRGYWRTLTDIQLLIIVHLFAKIGFAANDAATGLKLVEKGFRREDLALVVLMDFPFQMMGGWLAAKWSRGDQPLRPWIYAFWPRLFFALVATLIVLWFPKPPLTMGFFILLILHTIFSSFASYVSPSTKTGQQN